MKNYCDNCGAKLRQNAKFCTSCGKKIYTDDSTPMPYEKTKSIEEIYAEKKAMAEQTTAPTVKTYSNIQDAYAAAESQAANQNYENNQSYNQYQAFQSQQSGIKGWFYEMFLRKDGRLNRLRYFKRRLLAVFIGMVVVFLLGFFYGLLSAINPNLKFNLEIAFFLSAIVLDIVVFYLLYGLIIRRCHDLPRDSFLHDYIQNDDTSIAKFSIGMEIFVEVLFVSNVDIVILFVLSIPSSVINLYLLFAKGEVGSNEYGADPLERRYY